MKNLLIITCMLIGLGAFAQPISGLQQEVSETALLKKADEILNKPAKPFTGTDLNGQPVAFNELFDKPVILLFFSIESEKTSEFIVGATFLYDAFKDFGVKVYGLCLDNEIAGMKKFFKGNTAEFPVLGSQYDLAVNEYQVQEFGFPAAMIIAPNGLVTQIWANGKLYQRNAEGEVASYTPTNASSGPMQLYQSLKESIKAMLK